jgi:hypothetical protein
LETLFPEEVLGATTNGGTPVRHPFQPPLDKTPAAEWVFGAELKVKPGDWFDTWLDNLCNCIRRYNASLYRLRRLHLKAHNNATEMTMLPTDGGNEWLPMAAEADFNKKCRGSSRVFA